MSLWNDVRYSLRLELFNPVTKITTIAYVTETNNTLKTFTYKTTTEMDECGLQPMTFRLNQAVSLLNCIHSNGYKVSMLPV